MHQVKGRLKSAGESFKVLMKKVLWGIIMFSLFSSGSFTVSASAEHYPSPDYCDGIPTEIREYCEHIGYEFDICPEILEAIAYRESRFYPDVTNGNHYGLMQVNVMTHKDRIEKYGWDAADMFDPEKNIIVAADYLLELYETYGDENPIVLALYSGNFEAAKKYRQEGYICSYAKDILWRSARYERLHKK